MGELFSIHCPACGIELGIENGDIETPLTCECGFKFLVDHVGTITKVDYCAVPKWCELYLTESEKEQRHSAYRNEFARITLDATPFQDGLSIDQMIDRRHVQVNKIKAGRRRGNLGCLGALLILVGILVVAALKEGWVLLIMPGVFVWGVVASVIYQFFEKHKEDEDDLDLFAAAKERELARLIDNAKAKGRWKERMIREEVVRQNKELMIAREEARRREEEARLAEIRRIKEEARRNDEGMVEAIKNGVMLFDKFIEKLDKGDGHGYEERLMQFIRLYGFGCKRVSNSADQGVDLVLEYGGKQIAIQCKFKSCSIGNEAVREVHYGKTVYHLDAAWVISNQSFTRSAKEGAKRVGVVLMHHNDVFKHLNDLLGIMPLVQQPDKSKGIDNHKKPKKPMMTRWERKCAKWRRKARESGILFD